MKLFSGPGPKCVFPFNRECSSDIQCKPNSERTRAGPLFSTWLFEVTSDSRTRGHKVGQA